MTFNQRRVGISIGLGIGLALSGGAAQAAPAADKCGYAYVFESPIATSTAEQSILRVLQRAEKDFNIKIDVIDGTGLVAIGDNLRAAAAKGCYVAIGTAFFEVGDQVTQVAKDFPDQQFFIEGGIAEGPNVRSYSQSNEQGTYVAGAMAAKMSGGKPVGIIIGDNSPPLVAFSAGFTAGAKSVDPNITVLVNSVGNFSDPAKAGAIALTQASKGATLIYPAAGSNLQVYFLARDHNYQVIASDLTDYAMAKPRDPAVAFIVASADDLTNYEIIKQYVDGSVSSAATTLGLKDGVFAVPYVNGDGSPDFQLSPDVIAAGKKAFDDVASGKVTVPNS